MLFEKNADLVKALLGLRESVPHLQFCKADFPAVVKTRERKVICTMMYTVLLCASCEVKE